MPARRRSSDDGSPAPTLERLAKQAIDVAKKARRHRKNLAGDNFYGNKLAQLKADAINAFSDLNAQSAGNTTALAELIESIFSAQTAHDARLNCYRELSYVLRTTWRRSKPPSQSGGDASLFPLTILTQAKRGYLPAIGRQMNGCFEQGWYDACAVMMRRLVEISIIEAFEHRGIANKIKDNAGNYLHLSALVDRSMTEPEIPLSRNAKKALPQLRDLGHLSAHGRHYHATKDDIEKVRHGCRIVIEEFLRHGGLL
jgi:hypothetical protein